MKKPSKKMKVKKNKLGNYVHLDMENDLIRKCATELTSKFEGDFGNVASLLHNTSRAKFEVKDRLAVVDTVIKEMENDETTKRLREHVQKYQRDLKK